MSHLANCTFLAQLIATLIHYPCTVAIPGLAAWSAFLEQIFPTMWSHDWHNGTDPRRALDGRYAWVWYSPLSVLMTSVTSPRPFQACQGLWLALLGLIATPNSPIGRNNPPPASHPPPPPTPPTHPTPYTCNPWYYSSFEKSCLKSSSVSYVATSDSDETLAKRLLYIVILLIWCGYNLTWENHGGFNHLKSLLLKILLVTTWSVFQIGSHMWLDLREPVFHAHNKKIHFSPSHDTCTH